MLKGKDDEYGMGKSPREMQFVQDMIGMQNPKNAARLKIMQDEVSQLISELDDFIEKAKEIHGDIPGLED